MRDPTSSRRPSLRPFIGSEPGIFNTTKTSFNAAPVKVDFDMLTFNQITDRAERDWFNLTPSAFRLRFVDLDTMRTLAGHLLDESPEFQAFRAALGEDPAIGSPR